MRMKTYTYRIQGVRITSNEEISTEDQLKYLNHFQKKNKGKMIDAIDLVFEGENVNCTCNVIPVQFERIRRITGYLVGTLDRFNNGKKAEEHDRVKHATGRIEAA